MTLSETKQQLGEPDLAEEVILSEQSSLNLYQNKPIYPTLLQQFNTEQEIVLIHTIWQRHQHEIDSLYYQSPDGWRVLDVKTIELTAPAVKP